MADVAGASPARLTMWQAVRQSFLIHPDWSIANHLGWLNDEGYDTSILYGGTPQEVVAGWLAQHRTATTPAPHPPVPSADLEVNADDHA